MTLPEAKAELEKFVKLKTTLRPAFVDVLLNADLVEVVRCRECKHYDWRRGVCHNPRWGNGWANYPPPSVNENFFCADGAKILDEYRVWRDELLAEAEEEDEVTEE